MRHGLGARHRRATWLLVCLRAINSYLPGDEVDLSSQVLIGLALSPWHNAQEVGLAAYYTTNPNLPNKSGSGTGAILAVDWGIRVIVEALAP